MPAPTRAEVLRLGLPAPVAPGVPTLVDQAVDGTGTIFTADANSLELDAPVIFRAVSSAILGSPASSLPASLVEGSVYYARPVSSYAFQVATAPSPAAAISTFTAPAVGRFNYRVDRGPQIDQACRDAWTIVQAECTAHGGDVEAQILTDAAKYLAARLYIAVLCAGDAAKAATYDGIAKLYVEVYQPLLKAYFAGVPVRGGVDTTRQVAENGPALMTRREGPFRAPVEPGGAFGPSGGRLGPRRDRV